ncbi:MAG: response regulator transcription factor [bacterium]|nr:response regulator transcription factor [bacterium]
MIKVCLADNYPIVHIGLKSYFEDYVDISIVANVCDFLMLENTLLTKEIDVLVLDLELKGISGISEIKLILKDFPKIKIIIFSGMSEQIYGPNIIKVGVSGFVNKKEKLETLAISILRVYQGVIILREEFKKNLISIEKQSTSKQLYQKFSNQEVEILRYLCDGKKNHEISKILKLKQTTICLCKFRLLKKLNVTNLIDLIKMTKRLEIV